MARNEEVHEATGRELGRRPGGVKVRPHCRFKSDAATISRDQQTDAGDQQKAAVDGPLRLASHEATRKDVDSLKEPDTPHK
jgi:hypothetical protein